MSHSVNVSGIAATTSDKALHDFFGFCGAISKIDRTTSDAVVHFEKPSAAKTALMLNGGTLEGSILTIVSDIAHEDPEHYGDHEHTEFDQSDKPRAGIAAEYLAKGYVLSDNILHRAIEIDNQQGISKRFLGFIKTLDTTVGAKALGPEQTVSGKVQEVVGSATQQAKTVDEQKGYSKWAHEYYVKALSSPFGQKVRAFYTTTTKQVLDIHEEARRITEAQKADGNTKISTDAPAAL